MKEIIQKNLSQIKEICGEHHVKMLWAFGSVVTDKFTEKSDVDLLVEFNRAFFKDDYGEYADNYLELMFAFEDLFKRKVDLVTVKPDMNPYFLKIVEQQKVQLYG